MLGMLDSLFYGEKLFDYTRLICQSKIFCEKMRIVHGKFFVSMTFQNIFCIFKVILLLSLFPSCSSHLGYGVLLWSETNSQLDNGQIITIIGGSKVTDSYVVSFQNKKYPISTSRIAFFRHLPNAEEYRQQFMQYQHWYAVNMHPSGLVIRSAATSKADQVYRLRPQQTVKILAQASSNVVLGNIEGRWYEVLTEDGVRGFAFDYYLRIENRAKRAQQVVKLAVFEQSRDELNVDLNSLNGIWYKKEYTQLLKSGRHIDLRLLMLPLGQLYLNQSKQQLELYLKHSAQASHIFPYEVSKVTNVAAELAFNGNQIRVVFIQVDEISLYFRNQGKESILELQKVLPNKLEYYKQKALEQRRFALSTILQYGSQLSSAQLYGNIRLQNDGRFSWSNTDTLTEQNVLKGSPRKGTLFFPYQLGPNLQHKYNQILTFVFQDSQELTFLLRINNRNSTLLRYVPPFMIGKAGIVNSDAFNEKLDIQMEIEGISMFPTNLF